MSLPDLVIDHWGLVEADFANYYQERSPLLLGWRRFKVWLMGLPAEARFIRAVAAVLATKPGPSTPPNEVAPEIEPSWLDSYNDAFHRGKNIRKHGAGFLRRAAAMGV